LHDCMNVNVYVNVNCVYVELTELLAEVYIFYPFIEEGECE